jgi:hypothetical protein
MDIYSTMIQSPKPYNSILNIINEYLDNNNISTADISKAVDVSRKKMLNLRNNDIKDVNLLLEVFNYIYPDQGEQEYHFLYEEIKNCNLKELRQIYKNKDALLSDLEHIQSHQYSYLIRNILERICMKNSRRVLKESSRERNTLC